MYKFKYLTKINGQDFMVIQEEKECKTIKLLDVECINQPDIREFYLITKDGEYRLFDDIDDMEKVKLPSGFKWFRYLYRSEEVCDNHGCPMATRNYYRMDLIKDKSKILLNDNKTLLDSIKNACDYNSWE